MNVYLPLKPEFCELLKQLAEKRGMAIEKLVALYVWTGFQVRELPKSQRKQNPEKNIYDGFPEVQFPMVTIK